MNVEFEELGKSLEEAEYLDFNSRVKVLDNFVKLKISYYLLSKVEE